MKLAPIVLIIMAALAFGQTNRLSDKEQRAVKEVERLGGTFEWVSHDDEKLLSLDVDNKTKVFDFGKLKDIKSLRVLRVFQGKIDESSLIHLRKIPKLELLVVTSDGLTDKGAKSIGKLVSLNKLDLSSKSLTGSGLGELGSLKSLKRLFLYNTTIVDADLSPLAKMVWLEELCLPMTVSDEGLVKLKTSLPKTSIRKF